jgi:hypothetical protein
MTIGFPFGAGTPHRSIRILAIWNLVVKISTGKARVICP